MISIICPFFNGINYISIFLNSYLKLKSRNEIKHELIFVNNNSTDNSEFILHDLVINNSLNDIVQIHHYNNKASSYAARNFGAIHAKGDLFLFVDIDVWFKPDWLEVMKRDLELSDLCAGNVLLTINDKNNLSEHYDRAFSFDLRKYAQENTGITANLGCHKMVWNELGGFKEITSGADREFCLRAFSQGYSFNFSNKAICYHPCRKTFEENLIKVYRVAKGKFELCQSANILVKSKLVLGSLILSVIQLNSIRRLKKYFNNNPHVSKIKLTLYTFKIGFLSRIKFIRLILLKNND